MTAALVASESRNALHRMNGALLDVLQAVLPNARWSEWIVNVIILHRTVEAVESISLETSATLFKGRLVCDSTQLNDDVRSLDGLVPLDESYAGYCIRTGNIVWVDNLIGLLRGNRESPLKNVYRSFDYVGVETTRLPNAEYVFPIRLRIGSNEVILGVLNCEWYSPDGSGQDNPFRQRDVVVDRILRLLERHARFLPLVLDIDASHDEGWKRLLAYYVEASERWKLEILGGKRYEDLERAQADWHEQIGRGAFITERT